MSFAGGYQPSKGTVTPDAAQESGDTFPTLCETCLGPNPYVRMIKLPFGSKLCKIAKVPFQSFRWKAGPNGRYKETIISFPVAKQKNICQVCLNDLQYGMPVGVRDSMMTNSANQTLLPKSDVGQHYSFQQLQAAPVPDATLENVSKSQQLIGLSQRMYTGTSTGSSSASVQHQSKIAFRNLPKLCSFWVQGTCQRVNRGVCPYRPCCGINLYPELASLTPEMNASLIEIVATHGAKEAQKRIPREIRILLKGGGKGSRDESIRKRLAGEDDLTKKYMIKLQDVNATPPTDTTNTTLWLGHIPQTITEQDIFDAFYAFGSIRTINIIPSKCAFVEFVNRTDAESAISQLRHGVFIRNCKITINWSESRQNDRVADVTVSPDDESIPPPPTDSTDTSSLPSGKRPRTAYAAMDASRLGTNF